MAQKEHEQIYPKPGWVEHDAKEIWARSQEVLDEALEAAGASTDDIAALGITNQRETTVVWDRNTGEPIHNALVWQDTRTDKLVDELSADGGQDRFREQGRPSAGDLLLGPQGPLAPRQRRRRPRQGRGRRPGLRQHGHLADLEPHRRHRRRPAHHRCDERQPHDADGPRDARPGTRTSPGPSACRCRCSPRSAPRARSTARSRPAAFTGVRDRRRPRRPAGGHLRPDLLLARRGQEHLRHRQLPAAQHGHGGGAVQERHAHDPGLQDRRQRRRSTAWRARSRSPGRSCSGCATTSR